MSKNEQLVKAAELMDNLKNENIEPRLASIKSLGFIGDIIGPERTRNELVPFLNDCVDDDDEVLQALAEVLGTLVGQVGGNSYAHILFPILESLCVVEDLSVRQKAVQSLNQIISQLSPTSVEAQAVELLRKMSSSEWICERCSSAGIYPTVVKAIQPKKKEELIALFLKLCNDGVPIVRRSAVRVIKPLTQVLEKPLIRNAILPLLTSLTEDDEDSIRICLSEPISFVSGVLAFSPEESKDKIIPLFRAQAVDRSWRIRFKTAEKITDLTKTLKADVIKSDVLPNFCLLLRDPEIEVKIVAASKLADFAKSLSSSETIVKFLLPVVRDLAKDDNATFKEALATGVLGLASNLSKSDCATHILPFVLDFLSDKQEVDVKTAAIANLERIAKVVDLEAVSPKILGAMASLSQDKQWRVRCALVEASPFIGIKLGPAWFDDKLLGLFMQWLSDIVYSVREAAIANLRKLGQAFGKTWIKNSLTPRLVSLTTEKSYIHRETGLTALSAIASLVGDENMGTGKDRESILGTLIRLTRDPVPNVRFVTARTLRAYFLCAETPSIKKEIKNSLERQLGDDDKDVKYFAEQALEGLK